jgi:ribonuclease HI
MLQNKVVIYTDGSSRGNPGNGGWGAIIIDNKHNKVLEIGGSAAQTTNNKMELQAAIRALGHRDFLKSDIVIHSDSAYVINGSTKWIHGWKNNGWKTSTKEPVLNVEEWQKIMHLLATRGGKVEWVKVKGHSGESLNERADIICTSFADGKPVPLFDGKYADYMSQIKSDETAVKKITPRKKTKHNTKEAYSYVSFVGGVIKTDKDWATCEKRVKGKKGAQYKKVFSKQEEQELIALWSLKSLF